MATQESPLRQELVRPAKPRKPTKATPRRPGAGPRKAWVGPRHLSQALDPAGPPPRRHALAQPSGSEAQAQKLPVAPYWRALVVRQSMGGPLPARQPGMAKAPLSAGQGAGWEIAVPGWSQATAPRPTPPVGEV
jgi:hypothetical protein